MASDGLTSTQIRDLLTASSHALTVRDVTAALPGVTTVPQHLSALARRGEILCRKDYSSVSGRKPNRYAMRESQFAGEIETTSLPSPELVAQ